MDSRDDSSAVFHCQLTQSFHDGCGSERIETCGWLIKENQAWISDEFDTD